MNTNKKTGRIVGALFLISNVTFLLGAIVFIESILGAPDYLVILSEKRTQVILGVLLELLNGIAYVGIAVLIFPLLRQRFASLALGYVGFRLIEFVMQVLADLSPLSLLTLSEEFIKASGAEAGSFEVLGTLLIAERAGAFQMVSITFGLGALMFYIMMYQANLFPRFISVWGFIGAGVVLFNTLIELFGFNPGNLGFLMLLNELFLGVWLVFKGFNPPAAVSEAV